MARYYGNVGYVITEENEVGDWVERVILKPYYGDILRNSRRIITSSRINGDFKVTKQISIVADKFAMDNYSYVRFVEDMGNRWAVESVDIDYPRLILTIGDIYHDGEKDETTQGD